MALKAGYKGIKKYIADKLNSLGDLDSLATDAEVAEQIKGQEQLLENTVGFTGKNLFNGFEPGVINRTTGEEEPSDIASRSIGYIAVSEGNVYKFYKSGAENRSYRVFTFDSAKTYIESDTLVTINDAGYYTVPAGVSYIRIQCPNALAYSDLVISHISVDYELQQKADNSVIATVENDTTASQAYAIGEHFMRNGKFATATAAIAINDTLTEGTNYSVGDVASEIEASFKLIRALTNVDDLNDIFTPGIYEISSSTPLNTPEGVNTCMLEVFIRGAGSGFYQRVSVTTSSTSVIYQRAFTGSPGSWKPWFKFEGTIVS